MIKKNVGSALAVSLGVAALAISTIALSGPHAQAKPGTGQVGPWDAMKAVTAKTGGKPIQATYAKEGNKYLYDVLVVKGQTLMEVEVDAATGKVGTSETVTPEEEGKEFVADLHKALGHPVKPEAAEKNEKPESGEKPD